VTSTAVLIGLDVGTTGLKGIAIDDHGRVLAECEEHYPLSTPRPGWAEQDPEDWWRATETVLAQLQRESGHVTSIGLSGQMHGLVALDSGGQVLAPAILWNDQRTAAECREIEATIGLQRLISLTGNRALPGYTAPKILWLRHHQPEIYARIARIALPKDYVRMRLCGEHVTDVADASGTLLLDVAARRWSATVLDALDIDPAWLPPVLESPELSGRTPDGVPVAAGAGDQAAGAIGVGIDRPGPASVVLGTSGVVFAAQDRFIADPQGRLHAFAHAVPQAWQVMGVMLSAAGSLEWARHALAPDLSFDAMMELAATAPAGSEELLFLPYLTGERTPHVDPDARGAFIGLSLRHDRSALIRSVLEGVAHGLRDSLDLIGEIGESPVLGRISGGGARSELWRTIMASALELPLERVAVDAGAAFGAAILGGVAAGVWPDVGTGVAATVRVRDRVEPDPVWVDIYRTAHERYAALYPALRTTRGGNVGPGIEQTSSAT
jgi:xylulokinase